MKRIVIGVVVALIVLAGIGAVLGGGTPSASSGVTALPSPNAEAATIAGNIQYALGFTASVTMLDGDVYVVAPLNGESAAQRCASILALTNDPNTASPLPLTSVVLMDRWGSGDKILAQCHR